jgi:hypothetical protein
MITEKIREYAERFKTFVTRAIPQSYRDDPLTLKTIYKWILIGLLIRFIFMPIACHADLLSKYWLAHMLADYFYLSYIYTFSDFFHGIFFFFLKIFMPSNLDVFHHPWGVPLSLILEQPDMYVFGTATVSDWLQFVQQPVVFRVLFLFKLPYLLFDIATAFLFLHIIDKQKIGLTTFKLWMINPILIFNAYLFGRFDVIAIFFIVLSFYFIKNEKDVLSAVSFGFAILTRSYPLLFLPFFIFIKKESIGKAKLILFTLTPILIWEIFAKIIFVDICVYPTTGFLNANERFLNCILGLRIGNLSLFLVSYFVFLFIIAHILSNNLEKNSKIIDRLSDVFLIVMCLFFAFGYFAIQYFVWIVPFLVIRAAKNRESFYSHILVIAGWILFWGLTSTGFGGNSLFGLGLFSPVSTTLANYPTLGDIILNMTPNLLILGTIARSIWSATLLYMVYVTIKGWAQGD